MSGLVLKAFLAVFFEGKRLYCVFIDFTKAFDYVVRDNIWTKLIKLGIRGNIFNIIWPCIVQLNQGSNLETS